MHKRVTVLCVCVCVCEESTALEHRFYDKVSIAADCLLRFQNFPLIELSDVSFTSYRSFCSSITVAALFLNHVLIQATACSCAAPPLKRMHKTDSIWSAPYATWCFLNLLLLLEDCCCARYSFFT